MEIPSQLIHDAQIIPVLHQRSFYLSNFKVKVSFSIISKPLSLNSLIKCLLLVLKMNFIIKWISKIPKTTSGIIKTALSGKKRFFIATEKYFPKCQNSKLHIDSCTEWTGFDPGNISKHELRNVFNSWQWSKWVMFISVALSPDKITNALQYRAKNLKGNTWNTAWNTSKFPLILLIMKEKRQHF